MNYKKIHDQLIEYCKSTQPRLRILSRNSKDIRLSKDYIYVEIHHIIPKSLGGIDTSDNLVELLPEEHIFIHMLRYKIFKTREDMLAVRFMLNGFESCKKNYVGNLSKKIRMGYAWIKQNAAEFRKETGWQTEDGRRRISEARKGTMVVKDYVTGEIIGAVETDHPRVINGDWVHHTKGRIFSEKEKRQISDRNQGQLNGNASGLSEDYFLEKGMEFFREKKRIPSWPEMLKRSEQLNFKWIKSLTSRFGGRGRLGFYSEMEKLTNTKYNPWHNNTGKNKNL